MVPGTWYLVQGTWYLHLVPGTWYLVHGTWYLVPSTWYPEPGTQNTGVGCEARCFHVVITVRGGGVGGRDLTLLTLFGQEDGRKWDVGRLRCCFVSLGGYAVTQAGRHKSVSFFKVDFPHPCLVELLNMCAYGKLLVTRKMQWRNEVVPQEVRDTFVELRRVCRKTCRSS